MIVGETNMTITPEHAGLVYDQLDITDIGGTDNPENS